MLRRGGLHHELVESFPRLVHEVGPGDARVDQAERERLLGPVQRSGVDELLRPPLTDPEAKQLQAPGEEGRTEADLVEADPGVLLHHHPGVAGGGEHAAPCHRVAVHAATTGRGWAKSSR